MFRLLVALSLVFCMPRLFAVDLSPEPEIIPFEQADSNPLVLAVISQPMSEEETSEEEHESVDINQNQQFHSVSKTNKSYSLRRDIEYSPPYLDRSLRPPKI